MDKAKHEEIKHKHKASAGVPWSFTQVRGIHEALILMESDFLRAVIVVLLIFDIVLEEYFLLLVKSETSLGREIDCFVSVQSRDKQNTQKVKGLRWRRSVFPFLNYELFRGSMSVLSYFPRSILMTFRNHMIASNMKIYSWRFFNSRIDVCKYLVKLHQVIDVFGCTLTATHAQKENVSTYKNHNNIYASSDKHRKCSKKDS